MTASGKRKRHNPLDALPVREGFIVTGLVGGGVRITAKPGDAARLVMRFAAQAPTFPNAEFSAWSPRMLPRIVWQLDQHDVRRLLGWLRNQHIRISRATPRGKRTVMADTAVRVYLAIVTAVRTGEGFAGCAC